MPIPAQKNYPTCLILNLRILRLIRFLNIMAKVGLTVTVQVPQFLILRLPPLNLATFGMTLQVLLCLFITATTGLNLHQIFKLKNSLICLILNLQTLLLIKSSNMTAKNGLTETVPVRLLAIPRLQVQNRATSGMTQQLLVCLFITAATGLS